jgi:hypothetical protein
VATPPFEAAAYVVTARPSRRGITPAVALAGAGASAWWLYRRLVAGDLSLDLDVGRTVRPLGPIELRVQARREVVFDVIAAPYLGTMPASLEGKIEILERSDQMVLAAHRTPVGGAVATTVETVRFERPSAVHFRLVRGPVPLALEAFLLEVDGEETVLRYRGELHADLWGIGRWWGGLVARRWDQAVASSLEQIKAFAEERAGAHRRRTERPIATQPDHPPETTQ